MAALVLAVLGMAVLTLAVIEHRDARDDLARARTELASQRVGTSADSRALHRAEGKVAAVDDRLTALAKGAPDVGTLDQQDLDAVRAAVGAGVAGKQSDYNVAVDQRTALDARHDALVEQLRQQANAVLAAIAAMN